MSPPTVNESEISLVYRMLRQRAIVNPESRNSKCYLGDLKPEDTYCLLDILNTTLKKFAVALGDNDTKELVYQSDIDSDQDSNYLVELFRFMVRIDAPPLKLKRPEALPGALLNFVLIWYILYQTIKCDHIPLQFTLKDLENCIPNITATKWLRFIMVNLIRYVDLSINWLKIEIENQNLSKTEAFANISSNIPWAIIPILHQNATLEETTHFSAFRVNLHGPEEDKYILSVDLQSNQIPGFNFRPARECQVRDEGVLVLLAFLNDLERDINYIVDQICADWLVFTNEPAGYVLDDEESSVKWWKTLMGEECSKEVSFSLTPIARALATIDIEIQTERIHLHADNYRKHWKKRQKNYIPRELRNYLIQASSEIDLIFSVVKNKKKKLDSALRYHKECGTILFRQLTSQDVQDIVFDDPHGVRDAKRNILPRIAERHGKTGLSAAAIGRALRIYL